ncbi:MAG: leucine-rich repeat protein [Coriobacteriaceae bacterium]|nr:leucine-rich repeat protein [Coriobacteriaceae bacterium]
MVTAFERTRQHRLDAVRRVLKGVVIDACVLCLLVSGVPAFALAADGTDEVGSTFSITDEYGTLTYTITEAAGTAGGIGEVRLSESSGSGADGCYAASSLVVDTVSSSSGTAAYTYAVTGVAAKAFSGNSSLCSVEFCSDLTASYPAIGENAFYGCTSLTSVAFPRKVAGIGSKAFMGCTSLEEVTFADDAVLYVVSTGVAGAIGSSAFADCTSLQAITIPPIMSTERKGDCYVSYDGYNPGSTLLTGGGNFYSGAMPYWHNDSGPVSRYGIGGNAFGGCTDLERVVFQAGASTGMFAYWTAGGVFEDCAKLKAVVYEADQAYWGDSNRSARNDTFTDVWSTNTDPDFSLYYAVDYYASTDAAVAEADDDYASGRLARVEYRRDTPTDALACSDTDTLDGYIFDHPEDYVVDGYADGTPPDPNETAASCGLDTTSTKWLWKLTGSRSRRTGLSESCAAYLVPDDDLSVGCLVSAETEALYKACDYNLSAGDVQDCVFDPHRYLYPNGQYWGSTTNSDAYNVANRDEVWFDLTDDTEASFFSRFEIRAADGTVLDSEDYTISFQRYVCPTFDEQGYFVDASLEEADGPLLMTVTPTADSGYTSTLQEWVLVRGYSGSVRELYNDKVSRTWRMAVYNNGMDAGTRYVDFSGKPYMVGIGTQDATSALLAAAYAGLAQSGVSVSDTTDAGFGISTATSFTPGGVINGGEVNYARTGYESAGAYAAAVYQAFERNRSRLGVSDDDGYSWSETAILVNADTLHEVSAGVSAYAYFERAPIFYVEDDGSVSDETAACLADFNDIVIAGGAEAIPDDTVATLDADGWSVTRLSREGDTAATLSLRVAQQLLEEGICNPSCICISATDDPIDAISALDLAGYTAGISLTAAGTADSKAICAWLYDKRFDITQIRLFGRSSNHMSNSTYNLYDNLCALWSHGYEPASIGAGDTVALDGALFTLTEDGQLLFTDNLWIHGVIEAGGYLFYGSLYTLVDSVPAYDGEQGGGNNKPGGTKTRAKKKQSITLAKKTVKVRRGKKVAVKVRGAKTKLAFKATKKVKQALKIKVKGQKKLNVRAKPNAKRATYKIKFWAKGNATYQKSAVKTVTVKVR